MSPDAKLFTGAVIVAALIVAGFALNRAFVQTVPGENTTTSQTSTGTLTGSSESTTASTRTTSASSFTFSTASPVQITSVKAKEVKEATGARPLLIFNVTFRNAGSATLYFVTGCGSSLRATIHPNSVIQETQSGPRCLCAEALRGLDPGQSGSAVTPGCWSGISYTVIHPGQITVNMTLSWWGDSSFQKLSSSSIISTFLVG